MDPLSLTAITVTVIAGLCTTAVAGLKAWNGWLDFKRLELSHGPADHNLPRAGGRIEVADLKERVRKLEAIAAGIEL